MVDLYLNTGERKRREETTREVANDTFLSVAAGRHRRRSSSAAAAVEVGGGGGWFGLLERSPKRTTQWFVMTQKGTTLHKCFQNKLA